MTKLFKQLREKEKNEWVYRYAHAVAKRLPSKSRQEIEQELVSNIFDMLPNDASEQQIKQLLQSLGSPAKFAQSYHDKDRYLISPALFPLYWDVLKLVAMIVMIIAAVGSVISNLLPVLLQTNTTPILLVLINTIFSSAFRAISAAIGVFGLISLIFALIEHFGGEDEINQEWSVSDLPELPNNRNVTINRTKEIIVTIITTIVLLALFIGLRFPESAIYTIGDDIEVFILMPGNIMKYFNYFMGLVVFYVISKAAYIINGSWNIPTAMLHTLYQLAAAILLIIFFNDPNFLNPDFIATLSTSTNGEINEVVKVLSFAMKVVSVIIVIATTADIIGPWRKLAKESNSNNFLSNSK